VPTAGLRGTKEGDNTVKSAAVAVLDVGKTNKKLGIYDRSFQVVDEQRTTIEPGEFNGLEVESTDELLAWFQEALARAAGQFDIRAVAITTHGATCVMLNEAGGLAHPVISYTSPKGLEVQDAFYEAFGDRVALHHATCTPDLGFTNMAKALFYVKTRLPDVWTTVRHVLFYDSYLSYELTGKMGMESTYLGNHSYLWNYADDDWSSVARGLGADKLFPSPMTSPWHSLGPVKPEMVQACGLPEDCRVTLGIHDSNANFLPYLAQGYEDFILNSTGTWCVGMRQSPICTFTDEEIAAKVLYNLDAFGKPVKTAIFPAGMEYDHFSGLTQIKDENDLDAARKVVGARKLFVFPGVLPDATVFAGLTAGVLEDGSFTSLEALESGGGKPMTPLGQEFRAALNLSLALQTKIMLERCGMGEGTTVIIEGGFANNAMYCAALAALCPDNTFALTNMKEGTSFGAALTGWMAAEDLDLEAIGKDFAIETAEVAPGDFGDLAAYADAFHKEVQARQKS
jgi:L-fuculokinase